MIKDEAREAAYKQHGHGEDQDFFARSLKAAFEIGFNHGWDAGQQAEGEACLDVIAETRKPYIRKGIYQGYADPIVLGAWDKGWSQCKKDIDGAIRTHGKQSEQSPQNLE